MFIKAAYAQCPVCVVTVGGGLLLAKKLGVDYLLASLWISGLNTAIAFWFVTFIKKPQILKSGLLWSIILVISTWVYLLMTKQTLIKGNTIFHLDKTILGLILGWGIWLTGIAVDKLLRKKNKGKVFFYYQKVIIPLFLLSCVTGLCALLIKNVRI